MPPKAIQKSKQKALQGSDCQRKNFKWEPYHLTMANYIAENYDGYKGALAGSRKMAFLRQMRDHMKVECSDVQLKNGFYNFIKKYTDVKQKLLQSGFGVDPEKDQSLNKGWILRECPYFEILDAVMGTRPNVNPPFIISTSAESNDTPADNQSPETLNDASVLSNADQETEFDDYEITDEDEDVRSVPKDIVDQTKEASDKHGPKKSANQETTLYVKKALQGIDIRRKERLSTKTPMGMFAKVMEEKTVQNLKVESEKLELQRSKFEWERENEKQRNDTERYKIDSQMDLEKAKLKMEEKKMNERKAERDHELQILKLKQDFELRKIELATKKPINLLILLI